MTGGAPDPPHRLLAPEGGEGRVDAGAGGAAGQRRPERLRDLAELVGGGGAASVFVESLQRGGAFSTMSLTDSQLRAEKTMLALKVNGVDLSLDHGFPARIIVPALPGVHNTKWVAALTFRGAV